MSSGPVQTPSDKNWWEAYPAVESSPHYMSPEELAALLLSKDENVSVIDVRRNDHAGGHIRGSTQWHAQTFYDNLAQFLEKYQNVEKVVFYCSSSAGRGPRCAGWYQDYLNNNGVHTSRAYVLQGGIKEWLARYGGDGELVDGVTVTESV